MSTNCLVKKLKGVVDNDSLSVFGKVKIKINAGDVGTFYWGKEPATMEVKGDLYFTNSNGDNLGKTMQISSIQTSYKLSGDEGYLILPNRYTVSYIDLSGLGNRAVFDIEQLSHFSSVQDIWINIATTSAYGDVTNLSLKRSLLNFNNVSGITGSLHKTIKDVYDAGQSMKEIHAFGTSIKFDYTDCQYMPNLTVLEPVNGYGDISKLGLTKVTQVYNNGSAAAVITGSIEDFVSNKITTGQTTGSLKMPWLGSYKKVTYNGTTLYTLYQRGEIPNNANNQFTWDAQGNITWS